MFRKNREKRMKKGGQLEDPTLTRLLELEKTFSTKGLSSKEAKELLTEHMDLWSEYKALHNVKSIMGEGHAYTGYSPDGTKFSSGYSGDLGVWPAQFQKSAEKMIKHICAFLTKVERTQLARWRECRDPHEPQRLRTP